MERQITRLTTAWQPWPWPDPDKRSLGVSGTGAVPDSKAGTEFDRVFVDRLRAAYGKIFPVIGGVRSGTRNDVVRKLARV